MIYVAGDHLATDTLKQVLAYCQKNDIVIKNIGAKDASVVTPLQQIIPAVADNVKQDQGSSGILICGTGTGVEIGANRFHGIRAALCRDAQQAEYARVYDNANVLCLGAWFKNDLTAILDAWLAHSFDGDKNRSQMIKDFDTWQ